MAGANERLFPEPSNHEGGVWPSGLSFATKTKEVKRGNSGPLDFFLQGLLGKPFDGGKREPILSRKDYLCNVYRPEIISFLVGKEIGKALRLALRLPSGGGRVSISVVGVEGMKTTPWGDNPDDKRHLKRIAEIIRGPYSRQMSELFSRLCLAIISGQSLEGREVSRSLRKLQRTVGEIVSERAKLSTEGGRGTAHWVEGEDKGESGSGISRLVFASTALTSALVACAPQPPAIIQETPVPIWTRQEGEIFPTEKPFPRTVTVVMPSQTSTSIPTEAPTPEPIFNPGRKLEPEKMPVAKTEVVKPELSDVGLEELSLDEYLSFITTGDVNFLKEHVVKKGDTSRPIVIMTYDDGGSVEKITKVLGAFESYGLYTTFFVTGEWLERNQDLAREIVLRGHDIGCHGWDHSELTSLSRSEVYRQLYDFLALAWRILPDYRIHYFRPPYGSYNETVVEEAASLGMQTVMWSLESGGLDAITSSRVLERARMGNIILSHSTRYYDVESARSIIEGLLQRGLVPVKISEGLDPEDMWLPPEKR